MVIKRESGTALKAGSQKGQYPYSVGLSDGSKLGVFASSKRGALIKANKWTKSKFNINKLTVKR